MSVDLLASTTEQLVPPEDGKLDFANSHEETKPRITLFKGPIFFRLDYCCMEITVVW